MIYILEGMDDIPEDFHADSLDLQMSRLLPLLSEERKKKAMSYHFYEDRLRSAAVYVLLRYGLKKDYCIAEISEFTYGSTGKPYLKKQEDIYFNLSHCKGVVVCMIGDTELGIDVQDRFSFEQGIADQICSENEKVLMEETKGEDKDKDRLLNRLWVLKEAYTKYLGTGMTIDIKRLDFHKEVFWDSFKLEGTVFEEKECYLRIVEKDAYCMAVCSNREEHGLEHVTMEVLTGRS